MRDAVLSYLNSLNLGSYQVSQELPFQNNGQVLYLKNAKWVYVDKEQQQTEVFIPVLNAQHIDAETTTVRVFFANDSKNLPQDYDAVLSQIKAAKDEAALPIHFRREVDIETNHEGDLMSTSFEFRFTKLIP